MDRVNERNETTTGAALVALLLIAFASRAFLWCYYEPASFPDSGTYYAAAQDLIEGGLRHSEGRRTPGYPMVIVAVGMHERGLVLVQLALGVATSLLLFGMALQISNARLAFWIAIAHSANLQQLFLELAVLSEAVSTFTVVAVAALTVFLWDRIRGRGDEHALVLVALGVLGAVTILVRPQFVFLLLALPLTVGVAAVRWGAARAFCAAALVAIPAFAIVFSWATYVYAGTGHFALSTQSGFSFANHSVAFVESAPPEYATMVRILLKYRDIKLDEQGHYGNTAWLALPELKSAMGMSLPEISQQLQRMSIRLFVEHPFSYAASVTRSFIDFWTVPLIWEPRHLTLPSLAAFANSLWWAEHKLLRAANVAFLCLVSAVLVSRKARTWARWDSAMTIISSLVLLSSLIQALADYGASSRYAVTIQSLVVLIVCVSAARILDRTRRTRERNVLQPTASE